MYWCNTHCVKNKILKIITYKFSEEEEWSFYLILLLFGGLFGAALKRREEL
jgi:hypothetical protein